MKVRALYILSANLLVFGAALLVFELGAQTLAWLRPSYDVLFLQPDRFLGWKQLPGLRWTWAGRHWYAADFSIDVQTNSLGLRDIERAIAKPADVQRIAMLGGSFIEAVQVPLEGSASRILESRLNDASLGARWEVLNFGISNYGVGQYYLMWRRHAREFQPDYVVIFVAKLHMLRTIQKFERTSFPDRGMRKLWIRPTFRLENGRMIYEPAEDYESFVQAVDELVAERFDGERSRRKREWITLRYGRQLCKTLGRLRGNSEPERMRTATDPELLQLNLHIIQELGMDVELHGGRLVIADMSLYFGEDEDVSQALRKLCKQNDFGYIPAYEPLLAANATGISTRWSHDNHFNPAGNDIFAQSLLEWVQARATRPR